MSNLESFAGIFIPLITPFNEDSQVDEETLKQLAQFCLDRRVNGFFVNGSAGQGPVMTVEQRKRVAHIVIELTNKRAPVVIMVGAADTETTIELALHAQKEGATAISVVPPYYYTDHSEYDVIRHIERVGDSVDLPIILYNNPQYVGTNLTPQMVKKIIGISKSVVGIKLAWGSVDMIAQYTEALPKSFRVFSGSILSLFPGFYLGACGTIHPPTSFFPELCVSYWDALVSRRYDEVMRNYGLLSRIVSASNRTKNKFRATMGELARIRGFNVKRYPRWDTEPLTKEEVATLENEISSLGFHKIEIETVTR